MSSTLTRRDLVSALAALPLAWIARRRGAESFEPWVEVNPANLRHNVQEIGRRVEGRPILAVVKNSGYGLGHVNVARALESENLISGFAVIKLAEALALREAGIRKPVLWMGPIDEESLRQAVAREITPMVYTPIGDWLERLAAERGRPVSVQICVDTGLGREGVPHRSAGALLQDFLARRGIEITGVMTVMSEDPDLDREQVDRLISLVDPLRAKGVKLGPRHAASSFGLFGDASGFLDQVRPGMALWGVYSELKFRDQGLMALQPVGALRARVSYVKQLVPGESAGYERAFVAKEPTWVATVPMGHVDGVPRISAKGGTMRINSRLSPIVAVSASHTIVALGSEQTCQAGDVGTLFDWTPGSRPEDLAAACGASVYDLMMHLDPTLPRRLV